MTVSTYHFEGRYACLADIAAVVCAKSEEAGLEEESIFEVESAVDEACSNIIEHAYKGENKGEIILEMEPIQQGIKIRITDHGVPFEPEKIPSPDTNAPLSRRKASGLGLFMMKKCMDEVNFDFAPGCNTLTLVKYRDSSC